MSVASGLKHKRHRNWYTEINEVYFCTTLLINSNKDEQQVGIKRLSAKGCSGWYKNLQRPGFTKVGRTAQQNTRGKESR